MHERQQSEARQPVQRHAGAESKSGGLRSELRGMSYDQQVQRLTPGTAPSDDGKKADDDKKPEAAKIDNGSAWAKVVRANFAAWDKDGDGTLRLDEALLRYQSNADKDDALAALRGAIMMMSELQALSNDGDAGKKKTIGMTEADLAVYETSYPNAPGDLAKLDEAYGEDAGKLSAEGTEGLYGTAGKPDYKALQQGYFGTCYYLAALTSLAARDPGAIMAMIKTVPGKSPSYVVTFPNAGSVTVVLDNQKELMNQAWTRDNGVWVPVMERAFAKLGSKPPDKNGKDKDETKELKKAEGGYEREGIEALTGHKSQNIKLRERKHDEIDKALSDGFARKALVCAAINKQMFKKPSKKPLPDGHAYSVLGYAAGVVTIRNPWGAQAKSELMTVDGNAIDGTDDGEFQLDLGRFIELFSSMTIEKT